MFGWVVVGWFVGRLTYQVGTGRQVVYSSGSRSCWGSGGTLGLKPGTWQIREGVDTGEGMGPLN